MKVVEIVLLSSCMRLHYVSSSWLGTCRDVVRGGGAYLSFLPYFFLSTPAKPAKLISTRTSAFSPEGLFPPPPMDLSLEGSHGPVTVQRTCVLPIER